MEQSLLYLDYAAATPLDPRVLAAMQPYLSDQFYNPSAGYAAAVQVRRDLDQARAEVAYWLGARPSEIIFTAGATEANNLAVHGIMRAYPHANLVVSAIEHDSVLAPADSYACKRVPVSSDGIIDLSLIETLIDEQTVLVSVMYANNEVGSLQPIQKLARQLNLIRAQRRETGNELPLYLHSDACQAANYLDIHVARLGVDLLSLNGSKIYGPKQTGILYIRGGLKLTPFILGGGQERGLRSGTENVAGYIGFAAALGFVQESRHHESKRLSELRVMAEERLVSALPTSRVNGSKKLKLPNSFHVTFPGQDNERLIYELDARGIQAAAGSACSASSDEPSHVLTAMGLTPQEAQSSVRFSFGTHTTDTDISRLIETMRAIIG